MINTSKFDISRYLVDDETIANYLSDCLEEGGVPLFLKAIGQVARVRGMTDLATDTGLTRASLYKALDETGNPTLSTMSLVVDSLNMRLVIVPKTSGRAAKSVYASAMAQPRAASVHVRDPGSEARAAKRPGAGKPAGKPAAKRK